MTADPPRPGPAPAPAPAAATAGPASATATAGSTPTAATTGPTPTAASGGPGAPGRANRRRRRWHRLAVPLGLAALLITATLVAHAVDQPDPTEPGFLSPVATDADGGSRLAADLRARGVAVRRETDTARALLATSGGAATLFVPAPGLLHPETVGALRDLPGRTRLVLVDPPRRVLEGADLPLVPAGRRWAARAVGPDADGRPCPLPEAARAGVAAVERQRYAVAPDRSTGRVERCYAGGLARVPQTETVVVGASDPFRNDRIDERGNRELAAGLLGRTGQVVWLDLDGPAPPPRPGDGSSDEPAWSPHPEPGDGDAAGDGRSGDAGAGDSAGSGSRGGTGRADRPSPPNPLWAAFPAWFWALLAQLTLAALLLALWRARRLGPPVAEPLPVVVRSAETVLGRARLYQRARARGPAAGTLRAAALTRLLPRLHLPADPPPTTVAAAVAARAGGTTAQAHTLLYGDAPATDRELLDLARALDRLTRTVAATPDPRPADAGPPAPAPADTGPAPAVAPRPRPAPSKEDPR
ncbi:DUF4350 domain-containing protein [Micromonospora okii]|uniref:DUF4350 domain-containing protein n=1 Tax=Micromonospora okii TaxID=1182970 RepID=UPI001E568DDE|nr:DUF4350 domain-containing protein [Micromonospora okii]